jgi:hypothetical protein
MEANNKYKEEHGHEDSDFDPERRSSLQVRISLCCEVD